MNKSGIQLCKFLVAAASIVAASSSHASLIPSAEVYDLTGTGIGAVSTILTIHDNDGTEAGQVIWNGITDVATGDVVGPNVQTRTQLFGDVGVTSALQIRIIFNASEPAAGPIDLDNLVLNIYEPNGDLVFTSGAFTGLTLPDTEPGTGQSGFGFMLDATQAAQANPFVLAVNRIGLAASVSDAQGGLETFFILRGPDVPPCIPTPEVPCGPQQIPEPGTLALLGIGLLGAGALSRRRRRM